jgi:hypothetical protein
MFPLHVEQTYNAHRHLWANSRFNVQMLGTDNAYDTHTHTHRRTRTHTHMHTHSRTQARSCAHARTYTLRTQRNGRPIAPGSSWDVLQALLPPGMAEGTRLEL